MVLSKCNLTISYGKTRELPGECSGDIFRTLDFPPSGNTLIFSNEGVKNLKPLNYIYSITQWKESFSKHLWVAFVVVFLAEWAGYLAVAGLNLLAQISDTRSPSGV